MAQVLDGKRLADKVRDELKEQVAQLGLKPCLAILQVGQRSDSNVYIKMKRNFGLSVGVDVQHKQLPSTVSMEGLEREVRTLNKDPSVHGIIVQLPFDTEGRSKEDGELDSHYIINLIEPSKDVDW